MAAQASRRDDAGSTERLSSAQGLPFPDSTVALGTTHQDTRLPALLTRLNDAAKSKVLTLQEYFVLAGKALRFMFARPFYGQDVVQQMDEIGVKSLGIVLLTGLFTGMVLALRRRRARPRASGSAPACTSAISFVRR